VEWLERGYSTEMAGDQHDREEGSMRVMRVVGEEMCRLCPEENCGRGSTGKLPAVPTFPMRLHGGELEATAHCSTRRDRAAQVRIMRCVGKQLRRLQAAATSGPGSSGVLSSMHFDTVL
jgi:hypothetical protein